jgi:plastocyanin
MPLVQPFSIHKTENVVKSVSNLRAAVKGGRHKTHSNFMTGEYSISCTVHWMITPTNRTFKLVLQPTTYCFCSRWFIILVMSPGFPVAWLNYSKHFVWGYLKDKVIGQKTYRSQKWESEMKSAMFQKETFKKWHATYSLVCNSAFNRKSGN